MSPICRSIANVLWVVFAISSFTEIRAQDMQWEEPWVLTWNERGLGPQKESFATEQQARAAMSLKESLIRLDEYHKNPVTYSNLKLTKVGSGSQANELMEMIQDAQSAVNRAGRMIERKDVILRGDTIREYKATLEKVYKSVSQFKSDLVAQTGKVNRQVFKQINQQISEYNRDADAYNKLIRSPELATRLHAGENSNRKSGQAKHQIFNLFTPAVSIEPVQESDLHGTLEDDRSTVPQNSRSSLAGKVGEAAFSSFEVVVNFSEDSVLFGEGPTAVRGSLIQSGNEIVMQTDKFEYRGTITGDRIIGIRTPIGTHSSGEAWKIEFGQKPRERTSVAGKTGRGRIGRVNGGADFWVTFQRNGKVLLKTSEDKTSFEGDWSEDGTTVTFSVIGNIFQGELKKNRLAGSRVRRGAEGLEDTDDSWWLNIDN